MARRSGAIAPAAVIGALLLFAWAAPGAGEQAAGGPVVGSKTSKVYHEPDCGSARRLSTQNRVPFPSPGAAEAAGYRSCRSCKANQPILMASLFAPSPPPAPTPGPRPPRQGGDGDDGPSFTADVAPVLVANCVGCHNEEDRRGGFDLTTFGKLMAGSESGAVIEPRKPPESELVLRIKGESTPKMPPGPNDLAAETIARIEAWILAGARLDPGADPDALLSEIAASPDQLRDAELARLSPEQRRERLDEAARARWAQAGAPGEPAATAGGRFVLYGAIPEARADRTVKTLDKALPTIQALLSRPGKPALGGPMEISVYVFTNRNHYAEFCRTVARQEPAEGDRARADLSGEAPYLAALDPLGGGEASGSAAGAGADRGLDGLLVEQLASGAVSRAEPTAPRWLAMGYGAFLASKLEPRGADVARLRSAAARAAQIGWTTKAGEALGDVLDPEETRAIGFSLFEWLSAANPRAVGPFVRGMLGGREQLDAGVQALFGASREQFLSSWGQWVASRYGRGR